MRQFLCILRKDLSLILRDRAALFWVFVFPILFAGFFGAAMSARYDAQDKTLEIAVVDNETMQPEVKAKLAATPRLEVHWIKREETKAALDRAATAAVVETKGDGQIAIHHEPGKQVEAMFIKSALMEAMGIAGLPITTQSTTIDRTDVNSFGMVFPAALMWGLMGCTAGFSLHLVQERQRRTMWRTHMATPLITIIAGKFWACFLFCLLVTSVVTAAAVGWFGIVIEDLFAFTLATLGAATCFSGCMVFLSVLGKREQAVSGSGWAVFLVLAMVGGGMVPYFAMPEWMRTVGRYSPVRWGIDAFDAAIWKEFSWGVAGNAVLSLSLLGLVAAIVGSRVLAMTTRT